ncbi:MAG: hypothetical protein QM770_25040 [Tepidisphaeraceae bacterium]
MPRSTITAMVAAQWNGSLCTSTPSKSNSTAPGQGRSRLSAGRFMRVTG